MKYLIIPITTLLLYAFGDGNNIKPDPRYEWLKILPNITSDYYNRCEGIHLDQTFYPFIYRDSINGFKVSGLLINSIIVKDVIEGNAVLELRKTTFGLLFSIRALLLLKTNWTESMGRMGKKMEILSLLGRVY